MDKNEIRKVARVLDKLPRQFRKQLHNVEIVVEERPGEELFSMPDSTPSTTRFMGSTKASPARSLQPLPAHSTRQNYNFRGASARGLSRPDELREQIRITLLHEIAHYFGFDDDEIDKLGY